MRKQSFVRAIDNEFALGSHLSARDEKAVRKTVSGLLKILHPHGDWTRAELREYVEFALEGRRRVKEQLKKLAPHDYAKTAFSYVERDTGHEYWVDVAEQPDDLGTQFDIESGSAAEASADGGKVPTALSTEELISQGESKHVEFKQTGRINLHTKQRDPVIEQMVVKSIAGFMNAEGGTLLIGVTDSGEVFGIERDLKTLGSKQSPDGFALWLNDLLDNLLGPVAAAATKFQFGEYPRGNGLPCGRHPRNNPNLRQGQEGGDKLLRPAKQRDPIA